MTYESIQSFVKHNRKECGLTQKELAIRSGVGLHFIRDLEQGKTDLRLKKVNQVLFMFGAQIAAVPLEKEDRE